jgi:transcriptional regulator with XRE-family HTH domain
MTETLQPSLSSLESSPIGPTLGELEESGPAGLTVPASDLEEVKILPPPLADPSVNKQLYANSPLAGSSVESAALNNPDGLFNPKLPNLAIIHEKPEHRVILYMKAEGYTNSEVADRLGMSVAWISQVTRQPWFQLRLMEELKRAGRGGLMDFLKVQAESSLYTLVDLRDRAESEQVRATCAINLLDRFLGKPVQRSEVRMEVKKTAEEVQAIDVEWKRLEEEEQRLTKMLGQSVGCEERSSEELGIDGLGSSVGEAGEAAPQTVSTLEKVEA